MLCDVLTSALHRHNATSDKETSSSFMRLTMKISDRRGEQTQSVSRLSKSSGWNERILIAAVRLH